MHTFCTSWISCKVHERVQMAACMCVLHARGRAVLLCAAEMRHRDSCNNPACPGDSERQLCCSKCKTQYCSQSCQRQVSVFLCHA